MIHALRASMQAPKHGSVNLADSSAARHGVVYHQWCDHDITTAEWRIDPAYEP